MICNLGFVEDQYWSNVKILLMCTASAVALWAQFNPYTFPDNRLLLVLCCSTFFIIQFLLYLIQVFVDADYVVIKAVPCEEYPVSYMFKQHVSYDLHEKQNTKLFLCLYMYGHHLHHYQSNVMFFYKTYYRQTFVSI